jgi:hypothetical protein
VGPNERSEGYHHSNNVTRRDREQPKLTSEVANTNPTEGTHTESKTECLSPAHPSLHQYLDPSIYPKSPSLYLSHHHRHHHHHQQQQQHDMT